MMDDFIMLPSLKGRGKECSELLKEKNVREQKWIAQHNALMILAAKSLEFPIEFQAASSYKCLALTELDVLLFYCGVVPKACKQQRLVKWKTICDQGKKPPLCHPWGDNKEEKLK